MHADVAISEVAAQQRGLITLAQLTALGVDKDGIRRRVTHGRLHRIHRGVYAVGTRAFLPLARELAAVLAVGKCAVLSHWSAGFAWEIVGGREGDVDISVANRSGRDREGIRIHRPRTLTQLDVTIHKGIRITTPERTILDLVETEPTHLAERAVNEARAKRLTTTEELHSLADGRSKKLQAILIEAPGFTRSKAERLLRALITKAGLPQPLTNREIEGRERDFVWPQHRLVVEFDGWTHHGTRGAFENDRKRDQELAAAGWRTMRITWRQLTQEPEALVARLARALYASRP